MRHTPRLKARPGEQRSRPLIAIANYGPHASLDETIVGIKKALVSQGYIEGTTIDIVQADASFDTALIAPLISSLVSKEPTVLITLTTPVSQYARELVGTTPHVFTVVADPVSAGLLTDGHTSELTRTGSSDRQDLAQVCTLIRELLPHARRIGTLSATGEANDTAFVSDLREATRTAGFSLSVIPVTTARDVPSALEAFRNTVDVIYVSTSGPIQPALPAISAAGEQMGIPVINAHEQGVREGLALASFGVNYETIGVQTGTLVTEILAHTPVSQLTPTRPGVSEHRCFINAAYAERYGIQIPESVRSHAHICSE